MVLLGVSCHRNWNNLQPCSAGGVGAQGAGGGGVGGSKDFYTGKLLPEARPLTLLCTTLIDRKGTPLLDLLLTNALFRTMHAF